MQLILMEQTKGWVSEFSHASCFIVRVIFRSISALLLSPSHSVSLSASLTGEAGFKIGFIFERVPKLVRVKRNIIIYEIFIIYYGNMYVFQRIH